MVVVTGAAGFIGSNLARHLAALGYDLWLVDHALSEAKQVNLSDLTAFRFSERDQFAEELAQSGRSINAIFHLGACSDTTASDWDYLWLNNVLYSQQLWNWCARHEVPFIYASSAATYGDGASGFSDQTPPGQLQPLNLYGKSKNEFDRWVLGQVVGGAAQPPRWAGVKFFNVYGPGESHKGRMASVVWHAFQQIRDTGELRLFRSLDAAVPDGEQRRDFVYVADCVAHLIWLWRQPHDNGLFNSGSGQPRTFLELAAAVFAAMGRPPRVRFIEMPTQLIGKYQNYTCADLTRLRATGWQEPPTSLEAGVKLYWDAVACYQNEIAA